MLEIVGNIAIGIFLLIVGAVSRPVFKPILERMNQPSPLTPQMRGQLTETLAYQEIALERLNYLDSHPRDLFLYFASVLIRYAPLFLVRSDHSSRGNFFYKGSVRSAEWTLPFYFSHRWLTFCAYSD